MNLNNGVLEEEEFTWDERVLEKIGSSQREAFRIGEESVTHLEEMGFTPNYDNTDIQMVEDDDFLKLAVLSELRCFDASRHGRWLISKVPGGNRPRRGRRLFCGRVG